MEQGKTNTRLISNGVEERPPTENRNTGGRRNSISNAKKREPCKILSLNAQGLINKDTKWKVDMLKEYVSENNIVIMNLT